MTPDDVCPEQPPLWTELDPLDLQPANVLPDWALCTWRDYDPDAPDDDPDFTGTGHPRIVTATVEGDLL